MQKIRDTIKKDASFINIGFFLLLITSVCVNNSCKPDIKTNKSEEEIFLEDHHSPKQKWGYIDNTGKLIIKNKYDDCRDFKNNLAAVNYKGKWGFIDNLGREVIKPIYKEAHGFKDNHAVVQDFEGNWIVINKSNKRIFSVNADRLELPYDNCLKFKHNSLWGYMSVEGDTISEAKYINASHFKKGNAVVRDENGYHLIDKKMNVLSKSFDKIHQSQNSLYRYKENGKYGYLNIDGEIVCPNKFNMAFDFMNNEALVKQGDEYKIVDADLKEINSFTYSLMEPAGDNVYKYFENDKWGLISNLGEILTGSEYDMFYNVEEGMLAFSYRQSWGFMNKSGRIIVKPKYPLIWGFKNGYARVIEPQKGIGFIDKSGILIIPPYFIEVRDFSENLARVQIF